MSQEHYFQPEQYEIGQAYEMTEFRDAGIIREIIGTPERTPEELGDPETVLGDPEDAENWHKQSEKNSCAIACQEFVAEQLLNEDFSEQKMIEYAKARDWYDPREGTPKSKVGNLLEAVGLEVERRDNCSFTDLMQALADGEKTICSVSCLALAEPGMADIPGIEADHVVEVIGVDLSDPQKPQVILNDPGVKNGQAIRHDLDVFMKAWDTGDNFAVFAGKGDAA